jgi:hypothetical protein
MLGSIDDEVRRGSANLLSGHTDGSADGPANLCPGTDAIQGYIDRCPSAESRCLQAFSNEFTDFGTGNLWQRNREFSGANRERLGSDQR